MKRYCEECNYELDDGYLQSEIICGACVNVADGVPSIMDGEACELCGDSEEVEGGLCAVCFGAAPVGVWFGCWGVS